MAIDVDPYFEEFDNTEDGFDYIENELSLPSPIPRCQGDTALLEHLAFCDDAELLERLLEAQVLFPRDNAMYTLGGGSDVPAMKQFAIRYDAPCAPLLVRYGGVPSGTWLLQAMLANDEQAAAILYRAGARLDHAQMQTFCRDASRSNGCWWLVLKSEPADDDYVRSFLAKHFHVDLAEFRSIDFNHFHGYLCWDHLHAGATPEFMSKKAKMEALLGFELTTTNLDEAEKEWGRGNVAQDNHILSLLNEQFGFVKKATPDWMLPRLPDGKIDAFALLKEGARRGGPPAPTTLHKILKHAKAAASSYELHLERFENDESDHKWRTRSIVMFLMQEDIEYLELRLQMLQKLLSDGAIDPNVHLCHHGFHLPDIGVFPFSADHVPEGGFLDDSYVVCPATLLDISVDMHFTEATEVLLRAGARVDRCCFWTQDRFMETSHWAWDAQYDVVRKRVDSGWAILRRIAPWIGRIVSVVNDLHEAIFVPGGRVCKRKRIEFERHACSSR